VRLAAPELFERAIVERPRRIVRRRIAVRDAREHDEHPQRATHDAILREDRVEVQLDPVGGNLHAQLPVTSPGCLTSRRHRDRSAP